MDWQLGFTILAIVLAVGFVVWRGGQAWRSSRGGCSGGCGCAKSTDVPTTQPVLIAPEQLTFRHAEKK